MKIINTDGMAFIGPGSEWFWTALNGGQSHRGVGPGETLFPPRWRAVTLRLVAALSPSTSPAPQENERWPDDFLRKLRS